MSDCDVCVNTTPIPAAPPCPPAAPCPPRTCDPQEWTCGGWLYKEVNGCTTRTRLVGVLPDGVYTNPVITLENGCISKIENGDRVLQMRPNPCTTPSGGGGGTAPAAVTLNPSNCNLTSSSALGLMTAAVFDNTNSNVQVTGCGTSTSPWVLTASTQATGDVNTYKCGISVKNPLSTPVVSIGVTSTISSLVGFSYDQATCASTLNFDGASYNTCGTEIVKGIVKTFGGFVKTISVNSNLSTVASITNDAASCTATINLSGADYNQCGTEIVKGVVKTFGGFIRSVVLPAGWTSTYDAATCTATITPPALIITPAAKCTGVGTGILYGSPNTAYILTNTTTSATATVTTSAAGSVAFNSADAPAGLYSATVGTQIIGYFLIPSCP